MNPSSQKNYFLLSLAMEMFELVQRHFRMCGIIIPTKPSKIPINVGNSTIFLLLCACVTLNAILLKEVSTFDEYTDILFHVVSNDVFGVLYAIIVWKTSDLFELINQQAKIVRASEY